ncbi:sensor histidine kinase [Roseicyclus marinus]|uniref:sensor histidine kinase n=1 Tax=Roseicyclus marinus TaxID=2161673 RepID=UPI00240FAECC|nr:HAMP domain-containing sensor histidine kinase [Roseicyclus marinus]MDG3041699.1 HAMP domain-containing sensor histidine kinase [Roseicyclus marinus]
MRHSLSGRFLILTIIFVMLAEVFIFVPSVARFREDYLLARLERAQIASLALLATDGMISEELERELLDNAEVLNVVLRRDAVRQLILSSDGMPAIAATYDLRDPAPWVLMRDALARLANPEPEVIRVIGQPVRDAGLLIEITMPSEPLRMALIDYGLRILALSAVISIFTALLLFVSVRRLMVTPIRRLVGAMMRYAEAPSDATRIIRPQGRVRELRNAEDALLSLQTELTGALKQRERLAQLGEAVAKISHDLRNMLSVATLVADRLEASNDPTVRRIAPRLVNSLNRAINLTEATLAFGRAEEPPPKLDRVALRPLVEDVVENDRLSADSAQIAYLCEVPSGVTVRADSEQLHRVLSNLVRNARQAIVASGAAGEIRIGGAETADGWMISVCDTGPGLPQKARDHLFKPFHGAARKGGSGLGLAICAELVRGHGGRLELAESTEQGTRFEILLPLGLAT